VANWEGSDRRSRLPHNWVIIRRRVLRRDGHQCTVLDQNGVRCPELAEEVDHVVRGDDHSMENLRAICSWHHRKKSSIEGGQARQAQWKKQREEINNRFRRDEQHPGML
jgi:5-methylcytosine-specific restriction protein A